jgi:hypothetical protein
MMIHPSRISRAKMVTESFDIEEKQSQVRFVYYYIEVLYRSIISIDIVICIDNLPIAISIRGATTFSAPAELSMTIQSSEAQSSRPSIFETAS